MSIGLRWLESTNFYILPPNKLIDYLVSQIKQDIALPRQVIIPEDMRRGVYCQVQRQAVVVNSAVRSGPGLGCVAK